MPELPEVETVARTLRPGVVGALVERTRLLRASSLHPLSMPLSRLKGRVIADVGRRGKLLLIRLAPGGKGGPATPDRMAVHLRMTGRLMTHPAGTGPGTHTRCVIFLRRADGPALLHFDDVRAFGQILLGNGASFARWDFWRTLGPEPLEMGPADLAARLKGGRAVKAALLDQKVLAGIGNIYADESLFRAGIHPCTTAESAAGRAAVLLEAIQAVLRLSIAQCGSSIRDYRDANGDAGAFQNSFAVYGRAGLPCIRCGTPLEGMRVAGRATVSCPRCQRQG